MVKYVGGKVRLLPQITPLLPPDYSRRRHVEPFAGSAALFFACAPRRARIADMNQRLMAMYLGVRQDAAGVHTDLTAHYSAHTTRYYYEQRERLNRNMLSTHDLAATFIYLNRTCFNGLYRENAQGQFNVAIGDTPTAVGTADSRHLLLAQVLLRDTVLMYGDFEQTLSDAHSDWFVFLDPPYHTAKPDGFTGYGRGDFTEADQKRLRRTVGTLHKAGAKFLLTLSGTPFIRKLYSTFQIDELPARRSVGRNGESRRKANDIVVRNY